MESLVKFPLDGKEDEFKNTSDINTKNLSGPTYETHAMDLVSDDNTPIQMYN